MIQKSDRLRNVHSDIRGPLYEEALRMQAAGTPVLKLNTGNLGSFGFQMPASVREALLSQLDQAVPYCDVRGMRPAREAIMRYHLGCGLSGIGMDDIFICNGVSEAASMLMSVIVGIGEEILLPTPCYSLWSNNTYLGGGVGVFYRCDPRNGFNPDVEDLRRKISPKTKAIVVINPNNPTGAVYSRETLLEIAEIARQNHLLLISDEIYDRLVMDNVPTYSLGALAPDVPCVTFNGLSKSHVICGFRCGWMVFSGPGLEEIKSGVMQLASIRLCGNALTQLVIPAALADMQSTAAQLVPGGRIYEQRKAVTDTLSTIDGVNFIKNQAAFYLFPCIEREKFDFESDESFAMQFLHEKHILVIPGHGFDWFEDIRCRIVMLPEPEVLRSAMLQLGDFLDSHRI
ncbi:MAG: aminotransferase class I/II-fold pyridoxal phosphate-dependent enzyme [Firmicutes bacterium]|nr:aminotransferase class I/II-fold pyridoxal phosphate-dependent enzyme [Bacillota bacterium]